MFYIKNLKLNNFRCFKSIEFNFSPNINMLIGLNGVGKTSVVEGISYLCLGKSFKNAKDKDVLRNEAEYFNIISTIYSNDDERIVIGYDGQHKRIKKGEKICKTLSEHVGEYKLISFSPDDLYIIKGAPAERRQFLDTFISQIDTLYLKTLSEYKKILKIRNEFLKNIIDNNYDKVMFDIINQKLIANGKKVVELREKYISILKNKIKLVSNDLFHKEMNIEIEYIPDVSLVNYEKEISECVNIDLLSKITTKGPQKDDICIYINNKHANTFSSQGQIRIAVLSMKLAVYEIFKEIDDNIIIVLDDVLSELDKNKQIYLLNYVKKVGQIFITTTDIDKIPEDVKENSNIIEIKEGVYNV